MSEGTQIFDPYNEILKLKVRVAELERIIRTPPRHDYADGVPAVRIPHEGATS